MAYNFRFMAYNFRFMAYLKRNMAYIFRCRAYINRNLPHYERILLTSLQLISNVLKEVIPTSAVCKYRFIW